MKIDRDYLPIAALAMRALDCTGQRTAPLTHLLVVRDSETAGRLVAANGFMLAVVPVTLSAADVAGLVHPEALKSAAKDTPKREYNVELNLSADTVISKAGASFPRVRAVAGCIPKAKDYTDISRVVPRGVTTRTHEQPAQPLSFNFQCLDMIGRALGGSGVTLWPNPIGPTGPVVIFPLGRSAQGSRFENGLPVAPYAVLMPMYGACAPKVSETAA